MRPRMKPMILWFLYTCICKMDAVENQKWGASDQGDLVGIDDRRTHIPSVSVSSAQGAQRLVAEALFGKNAAATLFTKAILEDMEPLTVSGFEEFSQRGEPTNQPSMMFNPSVQPDEDGAGKSRSLSQVPPDGKHATSGVTLADTPLGWSEPPAPAPAERERPESDSTLERPSDHRASNSLLAGVFWFMACNFCCRAFQFLKDPRRSASIHALAILCVSVQGVAYTLSLTTDLSFCSLAQLHLGARMISTALLSTAMAYAAKAEIEHAFCLAALWVSVGTQLLAASVLTDMRVRWSLFAVAVLTGSTASYFSGCLVKADAANIGTERQLQVVLDLFDCCCLCQGVLWMLVELHVLGSNSASLAGVLDVLMLAGCCHLLLKRQVLLDRVFAVSVARSLPQ